uniref:Uncharacterized protein n=1 Tax=Romanomermis culicivorax TaxID=13658 RepID=A0A915HNV6_ROMCU
GVTVSHTGHGETRVQNITGVTPLYKSGPVTNVPVSGHVEGLQGGPGAVPPLANVAVAVTMWIRDQQKWLGLETLDSYKHQSYGLERHRRAYASPQLRQSLRVSEKSVSEKWQAPSRPAPQ